MNTPAIRTDFGYLSWDDRLTPSNPNDARDLWREQTIDPRFLDCSYADEPSATAQAVCNGPPQMGL
jgi:hypothetical protein